MIKFGTLFITVIVIEDVWRSFSMTNDTRVWNCGMALGTGQNGH